MRVEQQANLIEQTDLRVGVDTLVHTEVATANEQAGLYVNMENSNFGNVSSTNVLKGLFSSCTTFEDVMANAEALDVENLKNQMAVLSNVMTPEDYQSMLEEGFDGQSAPLETIVTVTDKIKMALLEAGVDISDWGGRAPSQREIEAAGGSKNESPYAGKGRREADAGEIKNRKGAGSGERSYTVNLKSGKIYASGTVGADDTEPVQGCTWRGGNLTAENGTGDT